MADIMMEFSDPWLVVALLVTAAVMFLLEVCTPSFGILAGLGILALTAAVYFAFRINSLLGLGVLLGCIIGTPAYLYWMVKLLPNTPLGKRMFLKKARDATNEATPEADELAKLVGKTGVADSLLRPCGTIRIEGKRVVALAEHGLIKKGQKVVVIKAGGTDVVVRLAETNKVPQTDV
ncbi:MAG: hypothetical protein K8S55_02350 [Phycisphaerae bacterium]|nr:hypothetical protein [Phycisphaerae bacterium]